MTYARAEEPATVAVVYDDDGNVYDQCWTWEAGQNYANLGYQVIAVADILSQFDQSVYLTIEEAQAIYDHERKIAANCFGPGIRD